MKRHTPTAQTSAGNGANGALCKLHISGAMNAGVPSALVMRADADGCAARGARAAYDTGRAGFSVWQANKCHSHPSRSTFRGFTVRQQSTHQQRGAAKV